MMTEYEMRRISKLIIEGLVSDDRFIERVARLAPKRNRSLRVKEVAKLLGVSVWTVRDIAPQLGGTKKGDSQRGKWVFEEEGLLDRYKAYCRQC